MKERRQGQVYRRSTSGLHERTSRKVIVDTNLPLTIPNKEDLESLAAFPPCLLHTRRFGRHFKCARVTDGSLFDGLPDDPSAKKLPWDLPVRSDTSDLALRI